MKKEYYDEEKANYINKKLENTRIAKVYWPLVADIILRRRYEYELSDDIFKRDVDTFTNNVKEIGIGTTNWMTGGEFCKTDKRIKISDTKLWTMKYGQDKWFEDFYKTLAHECTHAMNDGKNGINNKEDRTFPGENITGTKEAFTECEAAALIFNESQQDSDKICNIRKTESYKGITPYVDVIAATFGVKRKELLSAAIKGKNELQELLNKNINDIYQDSNENTFFYVISQNISLLHSALYEDANSESINKNAEQNKKECSKKIYAFSEAGILQRLANLDVNNIDEFKEQFDKIKLEQKIISSIMEQNFQKKEDIEELRKGTFGYYEIANTKMLYIQEILKSKDIGNKSELIQNIQKTERDSDEIISLMVEKGVSVDLNQELEIPKEVIKKYNKEYTSDGMEWDNSEIIEYMREHQEEMLVILKPSRSEKKEKFWNKIENLYNRITRKNKTKLLTESTQTANREKPPKEAKSWDLSNWGIEKEEFAKGKVEDHSREELNEQREGTTSLGESSKERE